MHTLLRVRNKAFKFRENCFLVEMHNGLILSGSTLKWGNLNCLQGITQPIQFKMQLSNCFLFLYLLLILLHTKSALTKPEVAHPQ